MNSRAECDMLYESTARHASVDAAAISKFAELPVDRLTEAHARTRRAG
jgi:hypothetical protein